MQGKVALITGAAQGIGKAIGETLLQRGARVCLTDILEAKGLQTAETLQDIYGKDSVTFVKCDVTSATDLSDAFIKAKDTYGGFDIVCNNAGILHEGRWEKMLDINLTAVIRGTFLGVEHMSVREGGRGGVIINVGSAAGLFPMPFGPVYSASKFGVVGFSRSIGENPYFTKQGIRVNCLCPGFADTDIINMTEPRQLYDVKLADDMTQGLGVQPVSAVSEACMHLLDDPTLTGAVLKVTVKGSKFVNPGISVR